MNATAKKMNGAAALPCSSPTSPGSMKIPRTTISASSPLRSVCTSRNQRSASRLETPSIPSIANSGSKVSMSYRTCARNAGDRHYRVDADSLDDLFASIGETRQSETQAGCRRPVGEQVAQSPLDVGVAGTGQTSRHLGINGISDRVDAVDFKAQVGIADHPPDEHRIRSSRPPGQRRSSV